MNSLGFPDYRIVGNGMTIPINTGTPDVLGCYWTLDGEINGWDSPIVRVSMLPKIGNDPAADGEIPADLHYKGRELTMTLSAECSSEALRESARLLLAGALDLVNTTGIFYVDENVPKQLAINRANNMGQGRLMIVDEGYPQKMATQLPGLPVGSTTYLFKAALEIYAADPRKYAQTPVVIPIIAGSASVNNAGNTYSQNAIVTLTGLAGVGPLTISCGGRTMRLIVPTTPGPPLSPFPSTLVVDIYNKIITDGSGNNYFYLRDLTTPWLQFPPGVSAVTVTGATTGSIAYSSAWI